MISRFLVVALVGAGCAGAAGIGAYVAVRSSVAPPPTLAAPPAGHPLAPAPEAAVVESPTVSVAQSEPMPAPAAVSAAPASKADVGRMVQPSHPVASSAPQPQSPSQPQVISAEPDPTHDTPVAAPEPVPAAPAFEERTVAAASVIGIRMDTAVSSETARVEDRVTARVTRDVKVEGRTVIPAGSRLDGTVTMVDRGGKVRSRARIGVRFDTLVLGDTDKIGIQTETIFRDGEAPANEASSKIGASAVVGSILGAVIGGKRGAAIGGAAGAAGGTAAVMAGDRNAATIPSGTSLTVRLTSAVSVLVPHEE